MPSCEHFTESLPIDLLQLDSGQVDPVNSSVRLKGSGGQSCYVEVKNNSPHFTPVSIRYLVVGPQGERELCGTTYQIASFSTDIFKYSIFGSTIYWTVEVSLAADVDAALVLAKLYAIRP